MKDLKKYKDSIQFHYLQALNEASKIHLLDKTNNNYRTELLSNPQREINNTTCAEAFVETFYNCLKNNTELLTSGVSSSEEREFLKNYHGKIITSLSSLVSEEIHTKQGDVLFSELVVKGLDLINSEVSVLNDVIYNKFYK